MHALASVLFLAANRCTMSPCLNPKEFPEGVQRLDGLFEVFTKDLDLLDAWCSVMSLLRRGILEGAVTLGLGLASAAFGLAYLVISAHYPWPDFLAGFWGNPELGILFVAGGILAYGEGLWMIRSRLDWSVLPGDTSNR